ncbi:MAG: aminotransferase V, partial [Solirubrobacterales bacterium]|nr:aminotransferase V [Solirubrobacterales bacterium]
WRPPPHIDSESEASRLAGLGIQVRSIPGHGLIRASCGAWTSEEDVARLLKAVSV